VPPFSWKVVPVPEDKHPGCRQGNEWVGHKVDGLMDVILRSL
jgi:hypothetical protein